MVQVSSGALDNAGSIRPPWYRSYRCLRAACFEELNPELWSFAGGACSLTAEHHAGPDLSFLRFFFSFSSSRGFFYPGSQPILLVC